MLGPECSLSPKSYSHGNNPHLTKGYFPPNNIFWIKQASILNMMVKSTTLLRVSLRGGSKMGPSSGFSTHAVVEKAVKGWWENTLPFFYPCPQRKTFLYARIPLSE